MQLALWSGDYEGAASASKRAWGTAIGDCPGDIVSRAVTDMSRVACAPGPSVTFQLPHAHCCMYEQSSPV